MRLSALFFATFLSAQEPAFDLDSLPKRNIPAGALSPLAHLRAKDGGRFLVSRTDSPDLPLENPFQAIHSGSSVARSGDGGLTFIAFEVPGIRYVDALVFGQKSAGIRYVLGDGGSFAFSSDAGISWQTFRRSPAVLSGSTQRIPSHLVVDPRDDKIVYSASTPQGIARWSFELGAFLPVTGLPANATGPYLRPRISQLFAAAADALYLSTTPGGTWEPFARIPQGQLIAQAAFDVAGTRRIFVLTTQGQLLRTNDDGATWQAIPLPNPPATKIVTNPFRPGHVIFHAGNQAFVSIDGGATLQPISIPPASIPTSSIATVSTDLEFDPQAPNTVYADGRRHISQDSGITWKAYSPGRFGRRVCSTLEPEKCYAIGQRFDNFYIEKFDSQTNLQWASYWGDNDPSPPRTAFVGKDGLLWLNTGRQLARIAPEGRLVDVRPAPESLQDVAETANGRLVAILENKVAELDPDSLAPISTSQVEIPALPPLVASEDRVAFRTPLAVAVFKPGQSTATLLQDGLNFLPIAYAWAKDGSLLVAGNNYFAFAPRRSRVELYSWSGNSSALLSTLQGESSESVESLTLEPSGRVWLIGTTSSQRFPIRSPLYNGPPKNSGTGFATLLPPAGGSPLFSTYLPDASFPLASDDGGLDFVQGSSSLLGGLVSVESTSSSQASIRFAAGALNLSRLLPTLAPTLRIDTIEKRFDGAGGNWSKGSWLRVRSRDLANLPPFALPVWSADRPKEHDGAKLLLNGQPITLLGAGPGYLDAAIDNLDSDENGAPALLVLERNGAISQTLRLIVDRFDFELLPRQDNPELALCYNSDGSENSESNPAPAGSQVALFAIGSQGSPQVYLNPERVGEFDDTDWPTYSSDYVEDVPGVLPGIRYIGLTLKGLGRFTGTRKVGLYRYYEDQPGLYIWVRSQ